MLSIGTSVDTVTLDIIGLPSGTDFDDAAAANPASAVFSRTPGPSQEGDHHIVLTAIDNRDLASTPLSVVIRVNSRGPQIPTEADRPCTITGTDGPDRLVGSDDPSVVDVICGLGGADDLRGLRGNDVIIGGTGADRIFGWAGNDLIVAGQGDDINARVAPGKLMPNERPTRRLFPTD